MIQLPSLSRLLAARAPLQVRCELCGNPLGEPHPHVLELEPRTIQCACQACAILFSHSTGAPYRTIPDRVRRDPEFGLSPTRWAQLGIPVGLAFCFRDSRRGQGVICYPSPAGVVEGELSPDVWTTVRAATRLALEDDVEALLVRGPRGAAQLACYLVPISTAYELVGRLRAHWQGFGGGAAAEDAIAAFFQELDHRGGSP